MKKIDLIAAITKENVDRAAAYYDNCGADALYYYDENSFREEGVFDLETIKSMYRNSSLPIYVLARIRSFDDIKKLLYAGASKVIVAGRTRATLKAASEASKRFGEDRIYRYMKASDIDVSMDHARNAINIGFGGIALDGDFTKPNYAALAHRMRTVIDMPVLLHCNSMDSEVVSGLLKLSIPEGILFTNKEPMDMMDLKQALKLEGLPVKTFVSAMDFDDFKLNSDGMIPVITQDYKTGQVLMLAYMTRESYEKTIETGKMTYYSRSRQELWCKGDTSGHYQYVKSLSIDCDYDTILAKVAQIGAACHTGNYSCFFTDLVRKSCLEKNVMNVFEEVYQTILDRRDHPKEGSYTNYLFEKGIDKILKKVGEENTEVIIAAKNPENDELKYEICDLLYHLMVLMAEKDVTWKDIAEELAQRH